MALEVAVQLAHAERERRLVQRLHHVRGHRLALSRPFTVVLAAEVDRAQVLQERGDAVILVYVGDFLRGGAPRAGGGIS